MPPAAQSTRDIADLKQKAERFMFAVFGVLLAAAVGGVTTIIDQNDRITIMESTQKSNERIHADILTRLDRIENDSRWIRDCLIVLSNNGRCQAPGTTAGRG